MTMPNFPVNNIIGTVDVSVSMNVSYFLAFVIMYSKIDDMAVVSEPLINGGSGTIYSGVGTSYVSNPFDHPRYYFQ